MHIVIAPDKFKGSVTAREAAAHLAAGVRDACPGARVDERPVADGGEGTLDAALGAGFERHELRVTGPAGAPVTAAWGRRGDEAVVEMSLASGLAALPLRGGRPAFVPRTATSRGTGELISAALDAGCTRVVLGVGGSATTDGGAGMLTALGLRLLDRHGQDLPPGGTALTHLHTVDASALHPRIRETEFVLAADVDNPLLGPRGAAADAPGAGAAGGVGYAAIVVLGAERRAGIDVVLDLVGLDAAVAGADLLVTGEGSLDEQSLGGKTPLGVLRVGRRHGVPVVAVCGRTTLDAQTLRTTGFEAVHELSTLAPDAETSMHEAPRLLREVGRRLGRG